MGKHIRPRSEAYKAAITKLIQRRRSLGLTQYDLADLMNITQSGVSEVESLKVEAMISTLERYAEAVDFEFRFEVSMPRRPGNWKNQIINMEEDLRVVCQHYDTLRKDLCSNCANDVCSAHQPSSGILDNLRRNRND